MDLLDRDLLWDTLLDGDLLEGDLTKEAREGVLLLERDLRGLLDLLRIETDDEDSLSRLCLPGILPRPILDK